MRINICADIKHPPYEFINKKGDIDGFNVDTTRAICLDQNIDFNIELLEWNEAVKGFEEDVYEAIQGMSVEKERGNYIFPIKYLETLHVFYTTKENYKNFEINSLLSMKVGFQTEDVRKEILDEIKKKHNGITVEYSNQEDIVSALINKEIDIAIGNKHTILYYSTSLGKEKSIKFIGTPIASTVFSIAFKKENKNIADLFKKGMQNIKDSGEYNRIYDKWFGKRLDNYGNAIIENIDTGIIFISNTGRIVSMNESARHLLDLVDEDYSNIDRIKFSSIVDMDLVNKINIGDEKTIYIEKPLIISEEVERCLGINYSPFINKQDATVGVLINIKDITEQVKLKESLATKDRMETLGEMLSNVAHEIRNPLTSINNFINLIPDNIEDEEFIEALLRYVPKQIWYINKLLEDLLNYSKPSIGERENIKLKLMIEDIIEILKVNSEFEYSLYVPDDLEIFIDRKHLTQILVNILTNAIEASEKTINKKVDIRAFEYSGSKYIMVRDYGLGIEEGDLSKIFNPFYTTKSEGTGLGMYIVYNLVTLNDGEISIDRLAKGTMVTIRIGEEE